MWLRDSLPHDVLGLRVLIYGYDTRLPDSKSSQGLEAISSSFRTALRAIRRQSNVSNTNGEKCVILKLIKKSERNRTKAFNIPCTQFRRPCVKEGIFFSSYLKDDA